MLLHFTPRAILFFSLGVHLVFLIVVSSVVMRSKLRSAVVRECLNPFSVCVFPVAAEPGNGGVDIYKNYFPPYSGVNTRPLLHNTEEKSSRRLVGSRTHFTIHTFDQ